MDQNEQKRTMNAIFVEPEMVEDIPLSRMERLKDRVRGLRCAIRRSRFLKEETLTIAAAVVLVLLALLAVPALPVIALIAMLANCCRSAFRVQTA